MWDYIIILSLLGFALMCKESRDPSKSFAQTTYESLTSTPKFERCGKDAWNLRVRKCEFDYDDFLTEKGALNSLKNRHIRLFMKVQNFHDLIELNILFLKGVLTWTPYHLGRIMPETFPLVKSLCEMHKKGFLSTDGQPGNKKIRKCGSVFSQDRGYVSGYMMSNARTLKFVERLLKDETLFVETIDYKTLSRRANHDFRVSTRTFLTKKGKERKSKVFPLKTPLMTKEFSDFSNIKSIIQNTIRFEIIQKQSGLKGLEKKILCLLSDL